MWPIQAVALEPSGDGLVEGFEVLMFGGKESAVHVGPQKALQMGRQLKVFQRNNEVSVAGRGVIRLEKGGSSCTEVDLHVAVA